MNCQITQTEIDELIAEQNLSANVVHHLKDCENCRAFQSERARLRQMIQALPAANAPNDFNFKLKSRLRRTEKPATVFSWQKIAAFTAPAVCAAFALTFVLTNNFNSAPPTETAVTTTATPVPTVAPFVPAAPISQPEIIKPIQPSEAELVADRSPRRSNFAVQPKTERLPVQRRAAAPVARDEIISRTTEGGGIVSADTGLKPAPPSITPPGINLEQPKKINAGELLRTFGIETESDTDSLRVKTVKSGQSEIQAGDIIQKINGQTPANLTGNDFKEISVTVIRKNETKEVKILNKP